MLSAVGRTSFYNCASPVPVPIVVRIHTQHSAVMVLQPGLEAGTGNVVETQTPGFLPIEMGGEIIFDPRIIETNGQFH